MVCTHTRRAKPPVIALRFVQRPLLDKAVNWQRTSIPTLDNTRLVNHLVKHFILVLLVAHHVSVLSHSSPVM
jgi:hypothetical protein